MKDSLRSTSARRSLQPLALSLFASCAAIASCSGGDDLRADWDLPTDTALVTMLREDYGIRITGLTEIADSAVMESDGSVTVSGNGTIEVEGLGAVDIFIEETVSPAAQGGDVLLFVQEVDSGNERYFLHNVQENFVTIGEDVTDDEVRGVTVSRNADGTYVVWTFDETTGEDTRQTVPNGFEALQIVREYNDFSTVSPHVMLTAFALAHTSSPEGRTPTQCVDTAQGPPVCSLFEEFCDCAACFALGRVDGTCASCPDL